MKKLIFILLTYLTAIPSIGQNTKFYRFSLPNINEGTGKSIDSYVHQSSKDLVRNNKIDSCAKARADYFLDVIQLNSEMGKSFDDILDNISEGEAAHTELFGNPKYFIKPAGSIYSSPFKIVSSEHVKIKGEIMQEVSWTDSQKTRMTDSIAIVKKAIKSIQEYYETTVYEHFFKMYKGSASHDYIIKKWGNGKFGTSTRILIRESKVGENWVYQVMIYNLVLFSSPV